MNKENKNQRKQKRIRSKIQGTNKIPRLSVHRSNQAVYAQLIDDVKGETIVGVSEKNIAKKDGMPKTSRAKELGILLAKKALDQKIKKAVFDRGSYRYHGRVKQIAEGAREGGLEF